MNSHRNQQSEEGYSILEMLISLVVTVAIMVSILNVLEMTSRSGRVLSQVAQMHQSMRFGQLDLIAAARLTGRGGVGRGAVPNGLAVDVRNNVSSGELIAPGQSDSPEVVEGTDVLTLRGVMTAPLYQVDPTDTNNLKLFGTPPDSGEIKINSFAPSGLPMDLEPLEDVADLPEAILLVNPVGDYAVVELDPSNSSFTKQGDVITEATLRFKITGGTHTAGYATLNEQGSFPNALRTVAFVSILEEYRYYIRDDDTPMLSRARVYPGTDVPYEDDDELLAEDISKAVVDLQVAYGIDVDRSGGIAATEWLLDETSDNPADNSWNGVAGARPPLRYLRLTTLARTESPDPAYQAPPITAIEDREYNEVAAAASTDEQQSRMFRRRVFETTVTLRNL